MSKPRKTVEVAKIVEFANAALAFRGDPDYALSNEDYRQGVMHMVERVLHDANAYGGFRYLDSEYAAEGARDDERDPLSPVLRLGYDRTRVEYRVRTW